MSDLESVPDAARARKGDCVARVNFSLCRESRWDVSDWDDILEVLLVLDGCLEIWKVARCRGGRRSSW
jgi:hypothetical protein